MAKKKQTKKKRKATFKPHIRIDLSYNGYDTYLDRQLETTAEKFDGELYGAGYGLMDDGRDMGFGFYDLKKAVKFISAARRFKAVETIYSTSKLFDEDGCPFH